MKHGTDRLGEGSGGRKILFLLVLLEAMIRRFVAGLGAGGAGPSCVLRVLFVAKEHGMNSTSLVSRRSFLAASAGGVLATALPRAEAAQRGPYGGFKMGIQSYSLRAYSVDDALSHSAKLGLSFWESFRNHFPLTTDSTKIAEYKKKLSDAGVTLMAYGVEPFGKNAQEDQQRFEFAKAMGIQTISADPDPARMDALDKLVERYEINIAIHNHGPGARYNKIADTAKAIQDHHPRIGACVDCGHYLRSDEDPVKAIQTFRKRTYGVHLKDVKSLPGKKEFKILGEGDLDVVGCLRELKALGYNQCLALEYEENPKNPIADIQQCLESVRAAVKNLG
jgi:sugar phosphate isomerase/epimerase